MKKTLSFLLSVLLIFSCTACGQKDPLSSLFSKMENASFEESIVDFSKQVADAIGHSQDDFDLSEYSQETDSTYTYFSKDITLFNLPYTVTLLFSDNQLMYVDMDSETLLTEEEITNIKSVLQDHFTLYDKTSDDMFDIQNDVILVLSLDPDLINWFSYGIPVARLAD